MSQNRRADEKPGKTLSEPRCDRHYYHIGLVHLPFMNLIISIYLDHFVAF